VTKWGKLVPIFYSPLVLLSTRPRLSVTFVSVPSFSLPLKEGTHANPHVTPVYYVPPGTHGRLLCILNFCLMKKSRMVASFYGNLIYLQMGKNIPESGSILPKPHDPFRSSVGFSSAVLLFPSATLVCTCRRRTLPSFSHPPCHPPFFFSSSHGSPLTAKHPTAPFSLENFSLFSSDSLYPFSPGTYLLESKLLAFFSF